jgi:dinuclear metal center YbgI/SA1388 family protein
MRPRITDLLDLLEEMAPSGASEEWDNPGLQVGNLFGEIERIVLSLDPTLEAVREASGRKAQVLLSHHPLLFKPISCLDRDKYPGNVISEALANGISLIAAHTNLDVALGGINDILADLLGLTDAQFLQKTSKGGDGGLGRVGTLTEPMALGRFTEFLKISLSADTVRVVGEADAIVNRVAVVGGSGGTMIPVASRMQADLLVTGDVTYHQALEARNLGLALIDAGHFCTERAALKAFGGRLISALKDRHWDAEVELYEGEKDPFRHE